MTRKHGDEAQLSRLLSGRNELSRIDQEEVLAEVLAEVTPRRRPKRMFGAALAFAAMVAAGVVLVAPDKGELRSKGAETATFFASCGEAPCTKGGRLVFTVSGFGERSQFAALASRDDGTVIWYFPSTDDGTTIDLRRRTKDGILDRRIVLGADHPPGSYRLFGVFSSEPLTRSAVKAILRDDTAPRDVVVQEVTLWVR